MATKTIYMNGGMDDDVSDSGYVYPDSDVDDQPVCMGSECYDQEEGDAGAYGDEEYPEFYANLEVVPKSAPDNNQNPNQANLNQKIRGKLRSMSIDSESSDTSKRPNFKCGSCKKSFLLDKNQKMIRCSFCGYRILFKLRTRNYITYKTE